MASRGLTISGSGTVSTRTSWRPCQVNARIVALLDPRLGGGFAGAPGGRGVGRDLTGFHQRLEAPEIAAGLDVRLALEQLGNALADEPGRRLVADDEAYHRAAPWPRIQELDPAFGLDARVRLALPRDHIACLVFGDFRDQLDGRAARSLDCPARALGVDFLVPIDILHEPRETREISPFLVQLIARPADRHRLAQKVRIVVARSAPPDMIRGIAYFLEWSAAAAGAPRKKERRGASSGRQSGANQCGLSAFGNAWIARHEVLRRVRSSTVSAALKFLWLLPILEDFDEAREPRVGLVPIDHAMVDGQRDIGHRQDHDRILAVHFSNHDALFELADAEDGGLPLMEDDRRGEQRTRNAVVGDGEATAGNVGAIEPALAGAAGEVIELRADLFEIERRSVLHYRNDETLFAERRADPDVDRRGDGDPVLLPAAVNRWRHRHRLGRGLHDICGVAELHAALGHCRLVRRDRRQIRLEQGSDVRRFRNCAHHVLGDRQPHPVERNVVRRKLPRLRARGLTDAHGCGLSDGAVDVLASHAAIAAGALDPRGVDAML